MTTYDKASVGTQTFHQKQGKGYLIWDWPVRVFHWGLVLCFLGAFVTNRLGVSYFHYHLLFGYSIIVLVTFRIFWGFVGTRHARFKNFLRSPKQTLRYLSLSARGYPVRTAGHNPLGAFMVMLLLCGTLGQAVFGLFGDDEIMNVGPFAALVSRSTSLLLTSLHRKLFYWIAGAVFLHVVAVLAHDFFQGESLTRAMIRGRKPSGAASPDDAIGSSRSLRAVAIYLAVAAGLVLLLSFAPTAEIDVASF